MQKFKGLFPFILTGILLGTAFPPMPLPFVAFFAFMPLLLSLESLKEKDKYILKTYLAFFIYHGMSNWWISSWQENTDPYLFISGFAVWIINPIFFLIPIIIYRNVRKKFSFEFALLSFPFIWTFFEWGHGLGELSYPWLNIGYSQIDFTYWIQQIDLWGIYGAGFIIAAINVLITYIYKKIIVEDLKDYVKLLPVTVTIFCLIALPMIYGYFSLDKFASNDSGKSLKVSIVQPNMDPWAKWSASPQQQVIHHIHLQDSLINISKNIDLSIWPETAIPYISMSFNSYNNFSFLQRWLDSNQIYVLTGIARYQLFDKKDAPPMAKQAKWDSTIAFQAYNSSILISPNSVKKAQVYNKSKLTPFAERIPYAEDIPFATDFLNWGVGISSWGKGTEVKTLNLHKHNYDFKIGTIICIESIYPEFCTEFVKAGANILTIITNDAWYNHTPGPYQHFIIARARAIENRRYIARSANSGISGLISPTGEIIKTLPQYTQAGIQLDIPAVEEISFYSEYGDYIGKVSAIFVFIILIRIRLSKYNSSTTQKV